MKRRKLKPEDVLKVVLHCRSAEILECMRAVSMVLSDGDRAASGVVTKRIGAVMFTVEWYRKTVEVWASK